MTIQLLAIGPVHPALQFGDRVRLSTGLELTLVHCDDRIQSFRAAELAEAEMWTEHIDCPGLYIRICDWPDGPGDEIDRDEAIFRALMAQLTATNLFELEQLAPLNIRRTLQSGNTT